MLKSMRALRESHSRGLSMAAGAVALGFLSSVAWAGEFYSCIDASGTMVFTDDASRIPPENVRSPVAVHRFQDSLPSPSQPRDSVRGLSPPAASVPAQSPGRPEDIPATVQTRVGSRQLGRP